MHASPKHGSFNGACIHYVIYVMPLGMRNRPPARARRRPSPSRARRNNRRADQWCNPAHRMNLCAWSAELWMGSCIVAIPSQSHTSKANTSTNTRLWTNVVCACATNPLSLCEHVRTCLEHSVCSGTKVQRRPCAPKGICLRGFLVRAIARISGGRLPRRGMSSRMAGLRLPIAWSPPDELYISLKQTKKTCGNGELQRGENNVHGPLLSTDLCGTEWRGSKTLAHMQDFCGARLELIPVRDWTNIASDKLTVSKERRHVRQSFHARCLFTIPAPGATSRAGCTSQAW